MTSLCLLTLSCKQHAHARGISSIPPDNNPKKKFIPGNHDTCWTTQINGKRDTFMMWQNNELRLTFNQGELLYHGLYISDVTACGKTANTYNRWSGQDLTDTITSAELTDSTLVIRAKTVMCNQDDSREGFIRIDSTGILNLRISRFGRPMNSIPFCWMECHTYYFRCIDTQRISTVKSVMLNDDRQTQIPVKRE